MITYRPLTINDYDQLLVLINNRPEVFNGYQDDQFKKQIIDLSGKMIIDPLWFNLGMFINGRLEAAALLKENAHSPSWTWGYWIASKQSNKEIMTIEGLRAVREMDQIIFDEMEQGRKLNRFFVTYRADEVNSNLKSIGFTQRLMSFMERSSHLRFSKYKFYTDCIVRPGEVAKYTYQQELLLNRTWPFALGIRLGMLNVD